MCQYPTHPFTVAEVIEGYRRTQKVIEGYTVWSWLAGHCSKTANWLNWDSLGQIDSQRHTSTKYKNKYSSTKSWHYLYCIFIFFYVFTFLCFLCFYIFKLFFYVFKFFLTFLRSFFKHKFPLFRKITRRWPSLG